MKRIIFNVTKDHLDSVIGQRKLGIKKRSHGGGKNVIPGEIVFIRQTGGGWGNYGLHSEAMITFKERVTEKTYVPPRWVGDYAYILDHIIVRLFKELICEKFDSWRHSTEIPGLHAGNLAGSVCVVRDTILLGYLNLINKQEDVR